MHDGGLADQPAVIENYRDNSALSGAGQLRAGDPQMGNTALSTQDVADVAAFLLSLDGDYE